MRPGRIVGALALAGLSTACAGLLDVGLPSAAPTPVAVPSPTPLPAAEVVFNVSPPAGTPADGNLALAVLDDVTGTAYNIREHAMTRLEDGRWQLRLVQPVGSMLRYRYVRRAPQPAVEMTAFGEPIPYRLALLPGPVQVDDVIAAWADVPYQGPTGRITGHVIDQSTGAPLAELLVIASGISTFTDGEGAFRLDGLPPGLHPLTVAAPDGRYAPAQQGAVVAAESTTPANLNLAPAAPVQFTFQLTVPSDTIPGTPVRMVGNIAPLGNLFRELPGGVSIASSRAPALTRVDDTHYILILDLYAGTDLRYKYTLGDGLWNAERDAAGAFVTRQLIVPAEGLIVADQVASWRGGDSGSIAFHATVPGDTPPEDEISIQFNPFTWFEPLPMWRLGENEWFFLLHGPLNISGSLGYRYCRNFECGGADDADTHGPNPVGRQATVTLVSQDLRDIVQRWQWWATQGAPTPVVAPEIAARPGFEVGIEFASGYEPSWTASMTSGIADVAGLGASMVTLTPGWIVEQRGSLPLISFDPRSAPFEPDLKTLVDDARGRGLRVALRPTLRTPGVALDGWWAAAPRDPGWWDTWFEEYRSFLVTHARAATRLGMDRLIVSGVDAAPALPGGVLHDGAPSGVPGDAEARWSAILDEVEAVYSGALALELEVDGSLQTPPAFAERFDAVHLYWHAPLAPPGAQPSVADMQAAAALILDSSVLDVPELAGIPLVLSVEYPSVQGGTASCPPLPDGTCRATSDFDFGATVDPDLAVDLVGQAQAINAVLLEAYARNEIQGFFVRGFNPVVSLQDKSASVRGKPARDILWYWYPRIQGTLGP